MVPRISRVWFEIVTGILFGTAITTAFIRLGIRLKIRRRLYLDDAFLGLACLFLLVATIILYRGFEILYISEKDVDDFIVKHRAEIADDVEPGAVILVLGYQRHLRWIVPILWLAIFSVKFSFLSFFHQLVDRLPRLLLYWRSIVLLNIAALIYFLGWNLLECSQSNFEPLKCLSHRRFHASTEFAIVSIATALDILTDVLIISIPVSILWQVRMERLQKLKIAAFLCSSICMVIIACIRSPGVRQGNSAISIWQLFWLEVETCAAVCMVSFTAFRSVFASEASNLKGANIRPWYSSTVAKIRRRKQQDQDLGILPIIPSATLSGMRTVIRGRDSLVYEGRGELSDCEPIQNARKAASQSSIIGSED